MKRGLGTVYLRGKTWWIQYFMNGQPFRESSNSNKKMVAKELLKKRLGEVAEGKAPAVRLDKVMFKDLSDAFLDDYKLNQRKSIKRATQSVGYLLKEFDKHRANAITTPKITAYIKKRSGEGAANATVNRELAALKRILNLAAKQTPPQLERVPFIPMLKENNIRKGFFEHGSFVALRDALPDYLKPLVTFAYRTGWREAEITNLTWSQVDLDGGIVRLEPGTTKNDDGRTVYLDGELQIIFKNQSEERKRAKKLTEYVFPNQNGTGQIKDFRHKWNEACRSVGLGFGYRLEKEYVAKWQGKLPPGPILHDFRRTAVRNMVRSGVPETVAMKISGHKTRSVFDRYNIVSEDDLKQAAAQQEKYLFEKNLAKTGTRTVTVADFSKKRSQPDEG
jgi:integrase